MKAILEKIFGESCINILSIQIMSAIMAPIFPVWNQGFYYILFAIIIIISFIVFVENNFRHPSNPRFELESTILITFFISVVLLGAYMLVVWGYSHVSSKPSDWLAGQGATLLGGVASALAFVFIVRSADFQSRTTKGAECLQAYNIAKSDLEDLSRKIAVTARLTVQTQKGGRRGALLQRDEYFTNGRRSSFLELFGRGAKIADALGENSKLDKDSKERLRRQVNLYVDLYAGIISMSPTRDLSDFLLGVPLGRAFCALMVASKRDLNGSYSYWLSKYDLKDETDC